MMTATMMEESSVQCSPEDGAATPHAKAARLNPSSPSSSSSPKRSRRSMQKRVVQLPLAEAEAPRPKGAAEGAPPSDSWAWRKYGQKPIKGSPYPRGYYRCSSSKGCPARKQVERSRTDPNMLVITYSCEHDHPWPLPKIHHHDGHQKKAQAPTPSSMEEEVKESPTSQRQDVLLPSPPSTSSDQDEMFSDLIPADEPSLMMTDEFSCLSTDVRSRAATSLAAETLLYAPAVYISGCAPLTDEEGERIKDKEEEDSLFAGLGDLPEFSVVFRRGLPPATAAG